MRTGKNFSEEGWEPIGQSEEDCVKSWTRVDLVTHPTARWVTGKRKSAWDGTHTKVQDHLRERDTEREKGVGGRGTERGRVGGTRRDTKVKSLENFTSQWFYGCIR